MTEPIAESAAAKPKRSRAGMVIVSLLVLAGVTAGIIKIMKHDGGGPPLEVYNEVPDFALTERSGRKVGIADLKGRVWIADVIFTNCGGPCPRMSKSMEQLHQELEGTDVMLVSVTSDPRRDTPDVLQEYANLYGASADRWWFLTGEKSVIHHLIVEGFKMADEEGKPEMHGTRFVLVDDQGHVRGWYIGTEEEQRTKLRKDALRLLAERAARRP